MLAACGAQSASTPPGGTAASAAQSGAPKKTIVVTYSVLGAVVKDLVGDAADVSVPMPNGQDPHEWEPSAKDIESIMKADLIVLDEPTAGLDAAGKEIYLRAMRAERARGATVITATHDIQEAAGCDLTMLLARKVVAVGPSEQVLTPEALLETFGIVMTVRDQHLSVAVVARDHGHDHAHDGVEMR